MTHGNCLFFAVAMWCRHGGYIAMRWPEREFGLRFLWSPDRKQWFRFRPLRPRRGWRMWIDMLWFEGKVVGGAK